MWPSHDRTVRVRVSRSCVHSEFMFMIIGTSPITDATNQKLFMYSAQVEDSLLPAEQKDSMTLFCLAPVGVAVSWCALLGCGAWASALAVRWLRSCRDPAGRCGLAD